ncbi:MAG: hypothetical protein II320_01515 [Oscillospiraceae bacterium]|nr:hypothetical protein [Oscillospiraceae bacterium]
MLYCPNCYLLTTEAECPICGRHPLFEPEAQDYVFLTEEGSMWSTAMGDLLKDNGIPFATRNTLGAALAAKIGPAKERIHFYVPYAHYDTAKTLVSDFFSAEPIFDEDTLS